MPTWCYYYIIIGLAIPGAVASIINLSREVRKLFSKKDFLPEA